jgi:hypothetical protein
MEEESWRLELLVRWQKRMVGGGDCGRLRTR